MQQKILDLLIEKHEKTYGGLNLIQLGELLKIGQEELKSELNALHKDKKITIKIGINHKYIYIK